MTAAGLVLLGLERGPVVLASASPRRRELLERMEVPLVVVPANVPENNRRAEESPEQYVRRLAREKGDVVAEQLAGTGGYVVLAADTIVEIDGEVLEKPADAAEADRFLARMGGRWHRVWTGLYLRRLQTVSGARPRSASGAEMSRVFFSALDPEARRHYIATGEPMDKAGAYGIQGYGGMFVPRIEGDYFNVMGLPLARLRELCHELEGRAAPSVADRGERSE